MTLLNNSAQQQQQQHQQQQQQYFPQQQQMNLLQHLQQSNPSTAPPPPPEFNDDFDDFEQSEHVRRPRGRGRGKGKRRGGMHGEVFILKKAIFFNARLILQEITPRGKCRFWPMGRCTYGDGCFNIHEGPGGTMK
jgi:hypothetical protein